MRLLTIQILLASMLLVNLQLTAKDDKKKPATELPTFTGGIVYALPRTGIRISVDVEQQKFYHGPYFSFAQKYLGINNAAASDNENWTITDVKFETFGEPDPAAVHQATGQVASLLSLSEDGVIVGINSEVKATPGKISTNVFPTKEIQNGDIWSNLSMHTFLAEKDSTKKSGSNFKTLEEKAAETAADILKLRKREAMTLAAKYDKLPPDGEAYKVMTTELGRIMDDYLALFVGKTVRKSGHYVFDVLPDGKNNKGLVAFRFSSTAGILPESNVSGKPIMLEVEPNAELKQKIDAATSVSVAPEGTTKGVFYRIPVVATVRLLNGIDVLAQARVPLAQFGTTASLPDGYLNGEYSIEYHPVTGAIRIVGTN